jgi:Dolichyl-phosphate-mannose-protein mannosyltransferase
MVYLVTRGWQHLFGTNEVVTRIPSTIAFLIASFGCVFFLRKRIGLLWACACVALFWSSPSFRYATELRPYALLLMFSVVALLSWDHARSLKHRPLALAGLLISAAGMMLCHVFAIFPLGALCLGELVHSSRTRKIDWPVWVSLLLPLTMVGFYLEASRNFEATLFPAYFQGGFRKLIIYFGKTVAGIGIQLMVAGAVACLAVRPRFYSLVWQARNVRAGDIGLWVGLMSIPILINVVLMYQHGAFFDRYCLSTTMAFSFSAVILLGASTRFSPLAGLCSGLVFIAIPMGFNLVRPVWPIHQPVPSITDQIHSDLPFVAASGLAFLEMDHYEKSDFLSHVYYLTDRPSAIQYAHATIFEGMGTLTTVFPIRANVTPYGEFIRLHRTFLVLGTVDFAEDWLLRKLIAEGAAVRQIDRLKSSPYNDSAVYEVSIPK